MKFSADWAGVVIGAIAFIQPWALKTFNRIFRKPRLEFHESAKIEVGLSNIGPTIALLGSIRAINSDIFVKDICVKIVKGKNKAEYDFSLVGYRSITLNVTDLKPISFKAPFGFLARRNIPTAAFPVFRDIGTFNEINSASTSYAQEMVDLEENHFGQIDGYEEHGNALLSQAQKEQFVNHVKNQDVYTDFFVALNKLNYWDAGSYKLIISIKTDEALTSYRKEFGFKIGEEESDTLKNNVIELLEISENQFLGKAQEEWAFVACDYE